MVERHESHWRASEKGTAYLHRLAMQTRGLVEVYAAAFSSVLSDAELGSAKNLTRRASEAFARSVLLGDIEATEVSNRATFQGALDELVRRRILVSERPPGAREAVYTRGPAFDELAALVERLAGAVSGG